MSDKKRKVPKLRFPGFTDAWEQRKLGEISKRVTRKNSNLESTLPLTISAQYGLVDQITFFNKQIASKDMSGYYLIKKGEFAYNKSYSKDAPWGAVKRLDNYDKGVLSSLYIVFKLSSNIDSDFVAKYFETSNWHSEVSKRATEGARDHGLLNISASDFLSIEILIPNKTMEQKEIAQFLKLVDSTLSLHQRKLDNVKMLKKSLLQKLFPKDGEKIPELRFPGFTDDWEQRKLGDMGKVSMCKRVFKSETSEIGEVPFYKIGTFGEVADSYISKDLFEEYRDKYSYPKVGDILISASGSIGRTVVYTGQAEYFQDSNIVWLDHGGKIDNRFLLAFYSVVKWSGIEGSTIKRLYNENILNTQISLPSLSEQATVGNFFREFDSLISLHQRKLDHLKELKKGLLQQMCV